MGGGGGTGGGKADTAPAPLNGLELAFQRCGLEIHALLADRGTQDPPDAPDRAAGTVPDVALAIRNCTFSLRDATQGMSSAVSASAAQRLQAAAPVMGSARLAVGDINVHASEWGPVAGFVVLDSATSAARRVKASIANIALVRRLQW